MNAIIGSAVKIDNFFPMHARMPCDFIEVERELLFVANWNFYKRCFGPIGMNFSCIGQRLANPLFDPSENILDRRARIDRPRRIIEKCDCRVSRRGFDCAGNLRSFQAALCRKHFV